MCRQNKIRLTFILLLIPALNFALTSNNNKPVSIKADHAVFYHQIGKGIFTGHVIMQQGSTIIHANKMILLIDKNKHLQQAIAYGTPAKFVTINDPKQPQIVATANNMTYSKLKNLITLQGNAIVTQGENRFSADHLSYDLNKKILKTFPGKNQQTRIIVKPDRNHKTELPL